MKKLITISILAIASLTSMAQSVTVYDPYNATNLNKNKTKSPIYNNVQWNWSLITRGAFAMAYERKINNYISAEVGAGLTYFDPMTYMSLSDDETNPFGGYSNKYDAGYLISVGLRVYPKEMDEFEGAYAQPTIRHRTYNYTTTTEESYLYDYNTSQSTTIPSESFKMSMVATDFALLIGYQSEGWNDIMYNSYIGFGVTKKTYDYVQTNSTTNKYEVIQVSDNIPNIFLGFSLGFSF